ncbi:MAG: hypothetical protein SOI56_01955 [Eubacteriales bacterium]|jgi:uncharacterized membrane protein YczE
MSGEKKRRQRMTAEMRRRIIMTVIGVSVMGFSIGLFSHSSCGFDPFQVFCHGLWNFVSAHIIDISFGTFYAILNGILLIIIFFWNRHKIGLGTVINIFLVGYIADFSEWVMEKCFPDPGWSVKIALLIIGIVIMCFASALYFTADLGVSTYDAVALTVSERTKFPFRWARILSDLICVLIGWLLGAAVGIGTLITAFFMGLLIDFFNRTVAEPMRYCGQGKMTDSAL